jgi:hypothetical protein
MMNYSRRIAPFQTKVSLENIETSVEFILPVVCSKGEEGCFKLYE